MTSETRVSSDDQDLTVQEEKLRAAGCEVIRSEKRSGTTAKGRTELQTLTDFAWKGDTIVVTRIDRLARSIADLAAIVQILEVKSVALRASEQPVDTSTAAGHYFLQSSRREEHRILNRSAVGFPPIPCRIRPGASTDGPPLPSLSCLRRCPRRHKALASSDERRCAGGG